MLYYLAPMEGITGYIYRNAYNACFRPMDQYVTPFLAPKHNSGLSAREVNDILPEHNRGMRVVPQILTNRADDFLKTAETLREYGYKEVNLNLGCPSGTVVSKGKGSGFLAKKEELDRFLEEISQGLLKLHMKLSIKTRIGKTEEEEFEELLDIYNKYPLSELIIHPRVQADYYRNTPRLRAFGLAMNKSVSPVCYNGDLFRTEDVRTLKGSWPELERLMLGRGVLANPFLVEMIEQPSGIDPRPAIRRLEAFHQLLYEGYRQVMPGDRNVLFKMKELWAYLSQPFLGAEPYRKRIRKARCLSEYEAAVAGMLRETEFDEMGGFGGF